MLQDYMLSIYICGSDVSVTYIFLDKSFVNLYFLTCIHDISYCIYS